MKRAALGLRSGDRVEAVEAPELDGEVELRDGEVRAVTVGGRRFPVRAAAAGEAIFVWCDGEVYEFTREMPSGRAARGTRDDTGLRSPMPGKIIRTFVAEGDRVTRGATLLILEAMKMEHEVKAPRDGVVVRMPFRVGDQVEAGASLVDFAG